MENIRPAFRHHLATRNPDGIRLMVGGLYVLHDIRGWYQPALALFRNASDAFDDDDRPEAIVAGASLRWPLALVLSLLGRPIEGVAAADPAVEAMRRHGSSEELFFALLGKSTAHLYQRSFDEAAACIDEMSGLGDEPDSQWEHAQYWVAGLKPLGAFVALATADRKRAQRLLDESSAVLESLGDSFYMTWNLGHRGRLALADGRLEDAIDLFGRSADLARSIGFLRGLQVSLVALGDASAGAGRLDEAEAAFVESLDAADRTGMVAETLGTLVRIATVFAATGREARAVSILTALLAEPLGDRQVFTDAAPIVSNATTVLDGLRESLDDDVFDGAREDGSRRPYGGVVKDLVHSRDDLRRGREMSDAGASGS
jgi:tetratricopeptide (TPR) repeat protein